MLLAFAEARPTVDDHGRIDLVLRRSNDGGRTWGPLLVVARGAARRGGGGGGETVGNPVPIYVPREGVLLVLFCSNAAHVSEDVIRDGKGGVGRRVWLTRSLDAGGNWSTPLEITNSVKRPGWTWYATGPGGGIVLRNGTLVAPATHADGVGALGSGHDHSHVLLSHDRGVTWQIGGVATTHSNEATVAQLTDGSLLLNARDLSPVKRRILQASTDGGNSWGVPRRAPELVESPPRGCHGSMVATPHGETLFFASPSSPMARERLTLRRSDDGGATWPRHLVLHDGPSAYSSMKLLPDGQHLGVLYEKGDGPNAFFAERVVFERVRLADDAPLGALAPAS
jgi:sialidase-1